MDSPSRVRSDEDSTPIGFQVHMDAVSLAIFLEDNGMPSDVCTTFQGRSVFHSACYCR